jgi:pSer/pThr/pTyr-binding forkhead associated (FHA) protein
VWLIKALDRDGREIGHFELVSGELTIGREADRQLVLQSASVSRRHARIVVDNGGQPLIVDEGSSNGVLVNGVKISGPTPVGPQSRIDIAEFRIAVESMHPDPYAAPPPVMAPQPLPPMTPQPLAPVSVAALGAQPISMPMESGLRIVAEGGPYDGRVFELRPGIMGVGRAVDNDLVFEDPSLSRKHARVMREGDRLEVEDLGSSNGTYINNRKITRAPLGPGDVLRFGDLSFRVEGGAPGSTRSVEPGAGLPPMQLYALLGGGGLTLILVILSIVFLVRKTPPVQASGRDAIAKLAVKAEQHLERGRTLYKERKYPDAKIELDQAFEMDPANAEIRKYRALASHGTDDDRAYQSAIGMVRIGTREELSRALHVYNDMSEGAPPRAELQAKLTAKLEQLSAEKCASRMWSDCAWAICKQYEVAPADSRPDARAFAKLRDAEKKLAKDKSYQRCRAAN